MRRRHVGVVAGLVVLVLATGGAVVSSAGAHRGALVDPAVLHQVRTKGEATFWLVVRGRADLSQARGIHDWNERGKFVYQRLVAEANASQAGLRGKLQQLGVPFKPFWIVNAIRVTGDQAVLDQLASDPSVEQIVPEQTFHTERPRAGKTEARVASVEWNISNIKAPQVWSTYGDTGQGIVIASIDTGVQFDHPAVVKQYRGYLGPGSYDNNYNWYDPAGICGSTSPCDNVDHGTHTMGTMVGDDGAGNQIGVAPGAKWITAKGCESNSCSTTSLVSAGQWLLAPTDLNGNNPQPGKRPNIISNSWGGGGGSNFYQSVVDSWVAAGIFPAFANGNAGPGCGSAGSPGDYLNTYAVGAYDSSNTIASFSSRGPSAFASETKPNISAPGVNVRSSVPTNAYASFDGTSMATPHLAATVALMWAAAPSLVGEIAQTRQILDQTAVDTTDTSCGGTAADNDVYGEGRLDAFAAVTASPRGATGTLTGNVTGVGGTPLAGAEVDLTGTASRTVFTDAAGHYQLTLGVGSYDMTVKSFGYLNGSSTAVPITNGNTTTRNFPLTQAPSSSLSGTVRDGANQPIAGATVTILNTPLAPVTTNGSGVYSFASVPNGSYDVQSQAGHCTGSQTQHVTFSSSTTLDFSLPAKSDGTYTCSIQAASYVPGTTTIPLVNPSDDVSTPVTLPSPFTYYGTPYTTVNVSTNGLLDFAGPDTTWSNGTIPSGATPNLTIYPYWDDLYFDGSSTLRTASLSSPSRFVIEWSNPRYFDDSTRRATFEAILYLGTGQILFQYSGLGTDARQQGNSATVGIENGAGSAGIQYSYGEAALTDSQAILFTPAATPVITTSTLPDATTGTAYSGATLAATGGTPGYTFSLAGGALPSALTLAGNGSISGNVGAGDAVGTYSFTAQVTDSASKTGTKSLSIDVRNPVSITTASPLPNGSVGAAYSQTIAGSGGKTPYTFSVVGGSLPPNLTLSAGGVLSGTPTTAGPYSFTVQLADSGLPNARTTTKLFSLTINSTGATAPTAPRSLVATPAKGKGNQLSWQAPTSNGGATITNYQIWRGTSPGTESLLTTQGTTLSYKDAATTRGQTYWYEVKAVNSIGPSPVSNEASATAK